MTSRVQVGIAVSATLTAVLLGMAAAVADEPKKADFLFVQSADSMSYDAADNRLTLKGVSPVTVFFTDRPERIAGNMKTTKFVPFWSEGDDSFKSYPPNADISVLEGKELKQTVVELQDPKLDGDSLSYTVKVIKGEMPESATEVAVFIDIIGRPLTPLSYAGVARRTYRRAFLY
ncbi:hypothetical protein A7A08_02989 [Methyloligella halotolerans]|uniref:Uncharacterized protein n=1 Tax=Methyloligella halotolerans TaxID=1177755 RepID=A0A1E2RV51_9HYPH|nr:hypothetical protein [Methyloligella halotolerans]ODA66136.1 hypothetical protein A7A08_02989 [Methyloligella halotolerans]